MRDCTLTHNTASIRHGAIMFVAGCHGAMAGSNFIAYNAAADGGKVPASEEGAQYGSIYGGGIGVHSSNVTITGDCRVVHNRVITEGGGGGGIIIGNGGRLATGPGLLLVANNSCPGLGGGVLVSQGSQFQADSARIEGNRALTGGGIYIQDTSRVSMTRAVIADNTATSSGGGIRVLHMGALNVTNATVANNSVRVLPAHTPVQASARKPNAAPAFAATPACAASG